jgi:aryl-alcohol dehydrogenase-like predicted oxidoreductase
MLRRRFGRTGWEVAAVGFGAWAIGGSWGEVGEGDARAALHAALDEGVDFIDTADVYGDGRSERIIRDVLRERGGERPVVATKAGRRLSPHVAEGYTRENLTAFVDRSLSNLGVDALDLVQLTARRRRSTTIPRSSAPSTTLRRWGSCATTASQSRRSRGDEGRGVRRRRLGPDHLEYVRHRPAERFFPLAGEKGVAVIARVPSPPVCSPARCVPRQPLRPDDHRAFNREGESFDKGETFSGVPYDVALEAVEELRRLLPAGVPMAQAALRWCLMEDAVSVVIPGAKTAEQARSNAAAGRLPPLDPGAMEEVRRVYRERIAPHVYQLW